MGIFDNATSVVINNKEVQSIVRVSDGAVLYQKAASHSYALAFSSATYQTDSSGDVTVSVTLTDNGSPVSGQTVSFSDGTSLYTGITNSNGVASVTVNCQADSTLTATYEDASATATIISNWVFLGLEFIGTGNKFRGYQQDSLTYTGSLSIDWGDGTIETMSSGKLAHEYSVSDTYTIRVSGNITAINAYDFMMMQDREFNITSVIIPNTVTSIGAQAFRNNPSITSVSIPVSVTSMGTWVFMNCTGITDFQLYWDNPPVSWHKYNFPNNTDTYYTIPYGSTSNYVAKGFPSAKLIERSA